MKIFRPLVFALTGWVVSAIAIVAVGFLWPAVFPAIVRINHYYGIGPSLPTIIGIAIVFASPGGLVGGVIGSRLPREGGRNEQLLMAGIIGIILALPFACFGLWFFTGW
jgi:hypothetical protein